MQTKREWLAERGLAIAGSRGKFSTKAHEALEKARKEGVRWSDDNGPVATKISTRTGRTVQVTNEKVIADYTLTYPEAEFYVQELNGTKRSMREACNNCRVSLIQCSCGAPRIVSTKGTGPASVLVTILPKVKT